jgi:hypothetical protein
LSTERSRGTPTATPRANLRLVAACEVGAGLMRPCGIAMMMRRALVYRRRYIVVIVVFGTFVSSLALLVY